MERAGYGPLFMKIKLLYNPGENEKRNHKRSVKI